MKWKDGLRVSVRVIRKGRFSCYMERFFKLLRDKWFLYDVRKHCAGTLEGM